MQHTDSDNAHPQVPIASDLDAIEVSSDGLDAFYMESDLGPSPSPAGASPEPLVYEGNAELTASPATEPVESPFVRADIVLPPIAPQWAAPALPDPIYSIASIPPQATVPQDIPTFTLEHVLEHRAVTGWLEAVAIVEELCVVLVERRATAVPNTGHITITPDGTVEVVGPSAPDAPIPRLARLLNDLLSNVPSVPAPLRVLVTTADAHATVPEFAHAVAYFGRPDRRPLIRAVFQRCAAAPDRVELPQILPVEAPQPLYRRQRRRPLWVTAAMLSMIGLMIVTVAFTIAWQLWHTSPHELNAAVEGVAFRVVEDVARAGAPLPAPTDPVPDEVARPLPQPAQRVARAPIRRPMEPRRAPMPPTLPFALPEYRERALTATSEFAEAEREAARPVIAPAELVVVPSNEEAVYSSDDADVVPPVMTYPQLQGSALPEFVPQVVNRLELLVGADGSVQRVKMLSRPRRMADMMILSGIKMWKFRPASKGGRPVKYLQVLSWTVTP